MEFIRRMAESAENEQWGYELLLKRDNFAEFFDALRDVGMFDQGRNPGPVPGSQPGAVRIPYWGALDYLEACAKHSDGKGDLVLADKVLTVVRVISLARDEQGQRRDNYHTYYKFAEILGLVPLAAIRPDDLDLVSVWLDSRFDTGLVTRALDRGIVRRLLDSASPEDGSKACTVLRHCTAIRWVDEKKWRDNKKTPVTAADDYWLNELLHHHWSALGVKAGREASGLFLERVREVFGGIATAGASWLTRPAIEEHHQNHKWEGAANRVVEGARDVLLAWVTHDPGDARPFIADLLSDTSDVVRRIAVHVVHQRWDILRDVFTPMLSARLFDTNALHELYGLLRDRFAAFTPDERARTVEAIRRIPVPETGEEPERKLRYVQKRWLSAIAGKGDAAADTWFAELSADGSLGGMSEHPEFLSYMETRWGPGPSAYEPEELIAFAREGTLVARLNEFKDTGAWRAPTTSALVDALEAAAALDPAIFADMLPAFRKAKRPFQYGVINGLKQAWDAPAERRDVAPWDAIWRALVTFFEATVGEPSFWTEKVEETGDLTPNRNWLSSLIADFLKAGTTHDEKAYPAELLPRTWALLQVMLERSATEPADDEPMNRAINSPKGRVIEALFSHTLRACRTQDKATGDHRDVWASCKPTFEAELARCTNANYEFSTLSGAYVAQLYYIDPTWLRAHLDAIFSTEHETNFVCAAAGLAYASVTRPIYRLLVESEVMERVLRAPRLSRRTREQTVERVALAYLWGDEELDSARFAHLFQSERIEELTDISAYLWGVRSDELSAEQVDRILAFWERCIAVHHDRDEPSKVLFSSLSLLSCYVQAVDQRAERLLLAVAPFVHLGHHGELFIQELDRLAEGAAGCVSRVLEKVLDNYTPSYDFEGHLKSLLEKMAAHGHKEAAVVLADRVRHLSGMRELFAQLSGTPR